MSDSSVIPLWKCSICCHVHDEHEEAVACAAQGPADPPPWLAARRGMEVAGFGECGVVAGVLVGWYAEDRGAHVPMCDAGVWLSRNQECAAVPAEALDPMHGWDFLRYVDVHAIPDEAAKWLKWCCIYGIEPDPTKAQWWDYRTDEKRAAFVAALKGGAA